METVYATPATSSIIRASCTSNYPCTTLIEHAVQRRTVKCFLLQQRMRQSSKQFALCTQGLPYACMRIAVQFLAFRIDGLRRCNKGSSRVCGLTNLYLLTVRCVLHQTTKVAIHFHFRARFTAGRFFTMAGGSFSPWSRHNKVSAYDMNRFK